MSRKVCYFSWDGQTAICFFDGSVLCKDCPYNPFPDRIVPADRVLKRSKIFTVEEKKRPLDNELTLLCEQLLYCVNENDEDKYYSTVFRMRRFFDSMNFKIQDSLYWDRIKLFKKYINK